MSMIGIVTEWYRTVGPELHRFIPDRCSFYRICPPVRRHFVFTVFQEHFLGKILIFIYKSLILELSLVCMITWVNLIWLEISYACVLQLSLSWMSFDMEIFQEPVSGKILIFFFWKITDFENELSWHLKGKWAGGKRV